MINSVTNFKELQEHILENETPVMLTFGLDWSGKCVIYNWMVESIAQEFENACHFYKVEADQAQDIANHYKVSVFPTSLLLHKGDIVSVTSGVVSKIQLRQTLDNFIRAVADKGVAFGS